MKTDNPQFGPWTTTLHHGTQLELSAFWQRRLGRLASLATPPVRLSWASIVVLCIVAGMLLAVPRLRLETMARAEDQEEQAVQPNVTSAKPQAADEQPFTATFSNGVKVQLVGLSENPSKGKAWWTPDGAPLSKVPYARVAAVGHHAMVREICWRWINLPDDPDVETRWGIEPHYSGAGGGRAFDAANKEIGDLTAWMIGFDPRRETCTVRFSVSVGATPWKTEFSDDGRNLSASGTTVDGVRQGAIFSPARPDNGGTSITISYQIPNRAVRLTAVDKDGLLDRATATGGGVMEFKQMTFHFAGLPPEKIQRFELQTQTRTFETIEFRNVSLHPDKQTNVEIVRLPDAG